MFQKFATFLSRSPPVVLVQYSFFVFAIGLFALSVSIKRATVKDFQSDKAWSRVYGDLAKTHICAGVSEHLSEESAAIAASPLLAHNVVTNGVCALPQPPATTPPTEGPTESDALLLDKSPMFNRVAGIFGNDFRGPTELSSTTPGTTADVGAGKKAQDAAKEKAKKAQSVRTPVMKRFLHSMALFWTIRRDDACSWRQGVSNGSSVHITGTVCGSQLGMAGGNRSWVSFSAQLPVKKLIDCCGPTGSKPSQTAASKDKTKPRKPTTKKTCTIVLEKTCVSAWLPANSVPKFSRSPPTCPAFTESHRWLPIKDSSSPSCVNGTGILTPKQRKFHQKSFLFDIAITEAERAVASEHLSTLALCVLMVAIAMMAALVYRSNPEKRIVAVENLTS